MTGIELPIFGYVAMIILLFVAPDDAALLGVIAGFAFSLFLAASVAVYFMGW
jgi:hypothetical protein